MQPRQSIAAGAVVTVVGIAIAATAPILGTEGSSRTHGQQIAGGVVVVLGWALLAWSIHAFGRERG
jgi:sensor domain CHASE-containing protein